MSSSQSSTRNRYEVADAAYKSVTLEMDQFLCLPSDVPPTPALAGGWLKLNTR